MTLNVALQSGVIGFQDTELSLVVGINPCVDDDVCGDAKSVVGRVGLWVWGEE